MGEGFGISSSMYCSEGEQGLVNLGESKCILEIFCFTGISLEWRYFHQRKGPFFCITSEIVFDKSLLCHSSL